MRKLILRAFAAAALILSGAFAMTAQQPEAQQMPQLPPMPLDSEVRTGKLDNGLTYFIRHNETPKGQADFFIAQKVGSVLEEENQRGLAHFLEHMCFNGTTHFPGKMIIDWLESVGVKFGYNLNAYTSFDETVYNISQVPVARKSVQDSCLMILHDWSCDLTLDPAEIDSERGVIHEEWRRSNVGSMRIIEQLAPKIYGENRYGRRLPIGTMEVVDNFPAQALVDYYHKWYRPDNQAIIVVGDIDVDYIESKVKEIFSPITMPANAAERIYYTVEDTPGTIYAIGKDKEMSNGVATIMFKSDNFIPREIRGTQLYYQIDFCLSMIRSMLNSRLSELAKTPDAEFAQARASLDDFLFSPTKSSLDLEVVAKGNDVIPAFKQAYRELLRAAQHGFTVGEYERAKAEFLSYIEKQYEGRKDRDNTSYCREYAQVFTEGTPAPGIETEKQLYDALAQMIPVDALNQLLPGLITPDNRVFMAMVPDNGVFIEPTEAQAAEAIAAVEAETLEAYKDEMRTDPLIPALPTPGTITSSTNLPQWNANEYTLSNGVKVIVKPTEFKNNEIIFRATAKGGISDLDQSLAPSIIFLPYAMNRAQGLNDYSQTDLQKYTQGKQAGLDFTIETYNRTLEGTSTVKDLPYLMELIYATFTGINFNAEDFATAQQTFKGLIGGQESTPEYIFSKYLTETLFKAPSAQAISSAIIDKADAAASNTIVKNALANAADYTFMFIGNVDLATLVPLLEQYIATLPANAATATASVTTNPDFEPVLGTDKNVSTTKMETPQSWVFIGLFAKMPYTAKNAAMTDIAAQIMSKRLLNKVREEMGATYSIGCVGRMSRMMGENVMFQIPFPMKPEMKDEALQAIKEIVNAMTSTVTNEELSAIKEYMVKNSAEALEKNDKWADAIVGQLNNGVDTFLQEVDVLNSISVEDIQQFMADVLSQNNYREIILDPAE